MTDLIVRGGRLPLPGGGLTAPQDIFVVAGRITAIRPTVGLSRPDAGAVINARMEHFTAVGHVAAAEHFAARSGADATPLEIDAAGRIALPGFIDAHVHGAAAVFDPAVQLALLRQGVTSIVVGNDGIGFAPSDARSYQWSASYFAGIDGAHPSFSGGTMAELLATYAGTTPINVAALVPHGSVRYQVMGASQQAADASQRDQIASIVEQGLADGAVGVSTGLEYVPAAWADHAELLAITAAAARFGLPHVSHMRGYELAAPAAIAELGQIAAATGVATHISHLHGPYDDLAAALNAGTETASLGSEVFSQPTSTAKPPSPLAMTSLRDGSGPEPGHNTVTGCDFTFDSYPYLRGCSILAMVSLPTWLPLADPDATLTTLADPESQARIHEHLATLADLWPRTTMAWVPGFDPVTGQDLRWTEGLTIPQIAARLGVSPAEAALRILVASRLRASCVFAQPPTNSPASVLALSNRPEQLVGSDAIYTPFGPDASHGLGLPHPRGWGAFARVLAARVLGSATDLADGMGSGDAAWSWHDAVEHLSARAARRFRLTDRGGLVPGAVADIVLIDPDQLRDHATYASPRQFATGIDDVLVAGVPVLAGGQLTGATPGQPLRPTPLP